MKVIKYQLMAEVNHGTEEEPNIVQTFYPREIRCSDSNLRTNEEIAKREAYNGEYTIEDDGQPEPETPAGDPSVWDELDAAYQEGVDSV